MATVWLSVIVLIFVQNVFAYVCTDRENIMNCDVCIRCGGSWCTELTSNMDRHCAFASKTDGFCGGMSEDLTRIPALESNGQAIFPRYNERTVFVAHPDSFEFTYLSSVERKVSIEISHTTQSNEDIILQPDEVKCDDKQCKLYIMAKVGPGFCTSIGTNYEYIYAKIKVDNITEEGMIKYHVPCACSCSNNGVKKSPRCSGNGDFACGTCTCDQDWSGENCTQLSCKNTENANRGDMPCTHPLKDGVECSGNGVCGPCEYCICHTDREGSQYFDPENFCSDICMAASDCGGCLTNRTLDNTLGSCGDTPGWGCSHPMTLIAYNETLVAERDHYNRKVWARCNDTYLITEEEIYIEYFAMKDENGHIRVMVVTSSNQGALVAATEKKVPIILGVLVLIAAVAAVAGVMLWKHLNAAPPMPFSSPDYQNIDAEDCVGVNPLYKSPTTTFTNPQFGKC